MILRRPVGASATQLVVHHHLEPCLDQLRVPAHHRQVRPGTAMQAEHRLAFAIALVIDAMADRVDWQQATVPGDANDHLISGWFVVPKSTWGGLSPYCLILCRAKGPSLITISHIL